jgi:cytochrome c oxidase cbb3-type subunit 2
MKNGVLVFLAVFVALGLSWCGFVLAPARQLGGAKQTTILNSSVLYPIDRPGDANLGLEVYRANGCAACHTEQVRQSGVSCDVVLADIGKSPKAVSIRMAQMKLKNRTKEEAEAASGQIAAAGGNAEIHVVATGPDIARGWGMRRGVAEDFLYDYPVQLGSLRVGPDLANIGVREPDLNWQLVHLYAPPSEVKDSTMPPFRYLFVVRKIGAEPSPDALVFPQGYGPSTGYEVVPSPEAKELAAYLLSLRANVPLYDAPFTP